MLLVFRLGIPHPLGPTLFKSFIIKKGIHVRFDVPEILKLIVQV